MSAPFAVCTARFESFLVVFITVGEALGATYWLQLVQMVK